MIIKPLPTYRMSLFISTTPEERVYKLSQSVIIYTSVQTSRFTYSDSPDVTMGLEVIV